MSDIERAPLAPLDARTRNIMSQRPALIGLLAAVVICSRTMIDPAAAADYSIAYALETNGKTETGKLENCTFDEACRIRFHTMDAIARLTYFSEPVGRGDVMLTMDGDSACCYFRDGNDRISLDPKVRLHAVRFYAGRARRGNEAIRNQELGVLYLSFAETH
jgi:hypothetical protein